MDQPLDTDRLRGDAVFLDLELDEKEIAQRIQQAADTCERQRQTIGLLSHRIRTSVDEITNILRDKSSRPTVQSLLALQSTLKEALPDDMGDQAPEPTPPAAG